MYLLNKGKSLKEKILELCQKANYTVRVSNVSSTGLKILTLFPNRLFGKPKYVNQELIHELDEKGATLKRYDKGKWRYFNVPSYIIRPFIIQDIYLKCGFLGLDPELVIGYNSENERVKRVINAIPEPPNLKTELEKEVLNLYNLNGPYVKVDKLNPEIEPGIVFLNNFLINSAEKFLNEDILE